MVSDWSSGSLTVRSLWPHSEQSWQGSPWHPSELSLKSGHRIEPWATSYQHKSEGNFWEFSILLTEMLPILIGFCEWQNNALCQDSHILIPGIYDRVTLHRKRDFSDVVKLSFLTWGDYPGWSRKVQRNHKRSCKREAGGSVLREDKMMEAGVAVRDKGLKSYVAGLKMEEEAMSQGTTKPLETRKGKEWILLRASKGNTALCISTVKLISAFWLPKLRL